MNILAIDQGTTSTRTLKINPDGQIALGDSIEHRQIYPQSGWVEHDPEELIGNIRRCLATAGPATAIGIDNQGESCLAWDAKTKTAVSPVIVWQDNRTQAQIERLRLENAAALVEQRAGLPLDSYFSASKLGWILTHNDEAKTLLTQGRLRMGTTDAFFLDRLSDRFVTDLSTASRTALLNLERGEWDPELCELFGVPIETLPEIVASTGDFGGVQIDGRSIPISASVVDQQAALFGHGCRTPGDAKMTFGTGAFALTLSGQHIIRAADRGLLPTVAWQLAGEATCYALDGGVYTASSALNWARSLGLFNQFESINQFDENAAIARGLAFVPALTGLACPHWDRSAGGLWIGLTLNSNQLDLVQAILEGIAFRAAEVLDEMNDHVKLGAALSIDGGMSANPYFCQFLSDLIHRPVVIPAVPEITALGTALFAASGVDEPLPPPPTPQRIYEPRVDRRDQKQRFAIAVDCAKGWHNGPADNP